MPPSSQSPGGRLGRGVPDGLPNPRARHPQQGQARAAQPEGRRLPLGHRRGSLRLRVVRPTIFCLDTRDDALNPRKGSRLPPRVPALGGAERSAPRRPRHGADGDGDAEDPRGDPAAAAAAPRRRNQDLGHDV